MDACARIKNFNKAIIMIYSKSGFIKLMDLLLCYIGFSKSFYARKTIMNNNE
jgi:hypothetical protein